MEVVLQHESSQTQSADSKPRSVSLKLKAVAFGGLARLLARSALGSQLDVEGFLVNGSGKQSKQILLQIERCQVMPAAS